MSRRVRTIAAAALLALAPGVSAWAAAALTTPEQQAAAEKKKADAAAQAERDKKTLAESIERVSGHWRQRAQSQGWTVHPQVAVQQPPGTPPPAAATPQQPSVIRSEKHGTAPPSEDVKQPPHPQAVR